jgi:hypothetical protein
MPCVMPVWRLGLAYAGLDKGMGMMDGGGVDGNGAVSQGNRRPQSSIVIHNIICLKAHSHYYRDI